MFYVFTFTIYEGPCFEVREFEKASDVEAFYQEFVKRVGKELPKTTFRVIEGVERKVVPFQKVTDYRLE